MTTKMQTLIAACKTAINDNPNKPTSTSAFYLQELHDNLVHLNTVGNINADVKEMLPKLKYLDKLRPKYDSLDIFCKQCNEYCKYLMFMDTFGSD